jgi:hypothetical protein
MTEPSHPALTIVPVSVEDSDYAANDGRAMARTQQALENLGEALQQTLAPLKDKLMNAANSADQVELELSLAFTGKTNWAIVSLDAAASVKVKLTWKKKT